ncbi:hypothetical protein MMC17_002795 [Xylographa soralifera]|nr:hypothetical protein [Xylographa soralifera]
MPPFATSPCTVDDGPILGHINVFAFWTDSTWVLIWRDKTVDYVAQQGARRTSRNLLTDTAHRRHQKAVDLSSGAVVGFARWILPDIGTEAAAATNPETLWPGARVPAVSKERQDEAEREFAEADWSFDDELAELDEPVTEMKNRLMEGKGYLLLDHLAVLPEYRGQGVATMLVESGVREAEKMGLDVFVLGMKAALGVYKKVGFKLLDKIIQDDSRFGGKGEYGAYFLVKEAGKQ